MAVLSSKPWDARLAARLVAPLRDTAITPNHFTTLRLVTGLLGAWLFGRGDAPNLAAWLIVLSNFLDHTDGEFARLSGRSSRLGHLYDLACDALVTTGLFVGIGIGLRDSVGSTAIALGMTAGVAVAAIFQMRHDIERQMGKTATRQPRFAGFEAEDILYLLPVVTYAGLLQPFLYAAAIGAPLAALVVLLLLLHGRRRSGT
ncbi:MAG: CDP-alcohol phosphatidyltransferase family protein [Chromatiales bacterium]